MKMHKDYIITDNEVKYKEYDVLASLKIISGPFKNVEFHFGEVHVREDEVKKECSLSFNYDIISDHPHLQGMEEFESVLEVIMNDLLIESLKLSEEKYKNELRKENTEASNSR